MYANTYVSTYANRGRRDPAPVRKLVKILAGALRQCKSECKFWQVTRAHYIVPNLFLSSKFFYTSNPKKFSQTIFHLPPAPQHCIIFILDGQGTELKTTVSQLSKNLQAMFIAEKFSLDRTPKSLYNYYIGWGNNQAGMQARPWKILCWRCKLKRCIILVLTGTLTRKE